MVLGMAEFLKTLISLSASQAVYSIVVSLLKAIGGALKRIRARQSLFLKQGKTLKLKAVLTLWGTSSRTIASIASNVPTL